MNRRVMNDLKRGFDTVALGDDRQFPPRPLGKGARLPLGVLQRQRLNPDPERYLSGERQPSKADEFVVLDEDSVQRRPPMRR